MDKKGSSVQMPNVMTTKDEMNASVHMSNVMTTTVSVYSSKLGTWRQPFASTSGSFGRWR
jgi:hypothetical protein